jgi:predicted TIM-barrel fold metal-dependent hydrolase
LLAAGAKNPNIHVMLSGDFRFTDSEAEACQRAAELLDAFGASRLLWASDYPFTRYEDQGLSAAGQLQKLERWAPCPADRETILCRTPERLFGFGTA